MPIPNMSMGVVIFNCKMTRLRMNCWWYYQVNTPFAVFWIILSEWLTDFKAWWFAWTPSWLWENGLCSMIKLQCQMWLPTIQFFVCQWQPWSHLCNSTFDEHVATGMVGVERGCMSSCGWFSTSCLPYRVVRFLFDWLTLNHLHVDLLHQ